MKIYVNAKSKKEVNEKLAAGKTVGGVNHSMFGGGGYYEINADLAVGTQISIYEKMVGGSPYAKSYGTWNGKKVV